MSEYIKNHFQPGFVFFDVDDTLVCHKMGKVPETTREAIRQLRARGIPCGLATGRHLLEMEDLDGNDIPFDAYVMMNGQTIYNADRVLIDGIPFEGENKRNILTLFHEKKLPLQLMEKDRIYINNLNDHVISVMKDLSSPPPPEMTYQGADIYMAVCFTGTEKDSMLQSLLPDCRITRWHPEGVDIINRSGGKAEGIRRLLSRYGMDLSDALVFGDSENDIDMLSRAGLGIAVGNGTPEAKKAADYVAAPIEEDGIYRALKHFHLL